MGMDVSLDVSRDPDKGLSFGIKEKLLEAIDHMKQLKADYGDIRMKDISVEQIKTENRQITNLAASRSRGVGIRIYVNGAMGFAATSDMDNLIETVRLAYDTAAASAMLQRNKVKLSPKKVVCAQYVTQTSVDPFDVPLGEKLNILMECNEIMDKIEGLSSFMAFMEFRKEDVIFADTEGSYITQQFYQSGGGIAVRAASETDTQQRSYGNIVSAGYEAVLELKLPEHAEAIAREAVALSQAQDCPGGEFDLVLMPDQLQLQIHESVGHPTELDRVLGSEAAFAGASFLLPEDVGSSLKYGSEHVTIVADATDSMGDRGLGTFGYDDEGVPAQCITLVDKGIFKDFQSSRDNAPVINQSSHGMGISDGWNNLPIVRMTNINLQPGGFSFDELIGGIDYGLLLEQNKSWSIDDKRINFQFACEIAREIKDGKLTGRIFKNPIYTGKTTEFWGNCDGVCNKNHRKMIGVPNCGKGQPMQMMRVGHASQPARFRKVRFIANG